MDNVITTADTYIGQRYVSGLTAGTDNTAATVITVPAVNSGTFYIGAITDPSNTIVESDETNNALAGNQITNTRLYPDLLVRSVTGAPGEVVTGQTLTIMSTVRNQGKWSAGGVYVYFYLSADNVITSPRTQTSGTATSRALPQKVTAPLLPSLRCLQSAAARIISER